MKAILLIDHGSKRAEANEMLACMANLVQAMVGPAVIVEHAHMELAEPDIPAGFAACVERGATDVIAFPYMLSPGRHSTSDIPRLCAEAAARFGGVSYRMTDAFGVHEKLGELILLRAGVEAAHTFTPDEAACCWHPSRIEATCGAACRAKGSAFDARAEIGVRARH